MGYWAASDLAQYVPQLQYGVDIVSPTSIPVNSVQFQAMIDLVSAEVDSAMARGGWTEPVPSTATAYAQLKLIVKQGAEAMLFDRIPATQAKADAYSKAYNVLLEQIRNGTYVFLGVTRDTGETGRALPRGGTQSCAEMETIRVPRFF